MAENPPPLPVGSPAFEKKRRRLQIGVRLGAVLTLGPVLGAVISLLSLYLTAYGPPADDIAAMSRGLTRAVSVSLWGATLGISLTPVGLFISVLCRRKLRRLQRQANQPYTD